MAKSQLFYTDRYATAQDQIREFLNAQEQFLSGSTVKSTRAVGDAIQDILSNNFQAILALTRVPIIPRSSPVGQWRIWHSKIRTVSIT
jgi:hypothetical protein